MALIRKGPVSELLQGYLEASKQRTVLVRPLERYLLVNRVPSGRSHEVLHPSEVASDKWCPRWNQMVIEGVIEPPEKIHRLQMESIFAEGHAIHAKWQDWLGRMGVLYGIWKCVACGRKCWHVGKPDDLCEHGPMCIQYQEVPLRHGIWGGHADGIVEELSTVTDPSLLEIKSVGIGTIRFGAPQMMMSGETDLIKLFNHIARPFDTHIRQIQIYMELANRMYDAGDPEMRPVQSAIVIYENKANQSVKEFVVERDSSEIVDILEWTDEMEMLIGTGTFVQCPHGEKCIYEHN